MILSKLYLSALVCSLLSSPLYALENTGFDLKQVYPQSYLPSQKSDSSRALKWNLKIAPAISPSYLPMVLGDTIDNYGSPSGSTRALGVNGETGNLWNSAPALATLTFNWDLGVYISLHTETRLRPVIDAWYDNTAQNNIPLSTSDIDINEPSLGYLELHTQNWFAKMGRFSVHWSPSPEYGITLSKSAPYHDGLLFGFRSKHFMYSSLTSFINPWLTGVMQEDGSYPVGTENALQQDFSRDHNSRNQIYTSASRTLFAHRASWNYAFFNFGMTELLMVGGKPPTLRDGSPFVLWHNNYGDGYSNVSFGFDTRLQLNAWAFYAELFLDDIKEADDGGVPTQLGWMVGLDHTLLLSKSRYYHHVELIQTDPYLYNHRRPYTKLYQRTVIKSNHINLGSSPFIDSYVIDYPLGYIGGADRFDLRYRGFFEHSSKMSAHVALQMLNQGQTNPWEIFRTSTANTGSSPTGIVETRYEGEVRLCYAGLATTYFPSSLCMGPGGSYRLNKNHIQDKNDWNGWVSATIEWSLKNY